MGLEHNAYKKLGAHTDPPTGRGGTIPQSQKLGAQFLQEVLQYGFAEGAQDLQECMGTSPTVRRHRHSQSLGTPII